MAPGHSVGRLVVAVTFTVDRLRLAPGHSVGRLLRR